MHFGVESAKDNTHVFAKKTLAEISTVSHVNLLPGPVELSEEVVQAYSAKPVSHRSDKFIADFNKTKNMLCEMLQCRQAEILMGSGTLANDAVAGQLSLFDGNGLILVNGEFSRRLVVHAEAAGLNFEILKITDGETFVSEELDNVLNKIGKIEWLWSVHCETSTGVVNDIAMLHNICQERSIRLCLDCISSIGTLPVNLRNVYLASGVSGKGLGALPGLAMVFYNHEIQPMPKALPCYIDLGLYAERGGIPFTVSSNLLYGLSAALENTNWEARLDEIDLWSKLIRDRVACMGYTLVSNQSTNPTAVISINLPESISSSDFGRLVEDRGFLLSYKSGYLIQKNWVQICLMRKLYRQQIEDLLAVFNELSRKYILL